MYNVRCAAKILLCKMYGNNPIILPHKLYRTNPGRGGSTTHRREVERDEHVFGGDVGEQCFPLDAIVQHKGRAQHGTVLGEGDGARTTL